jgi:hypothetical protein
LARLRKFVLQRYDTGRVRYGRDKPEIGVNSIRQHALSAAQCDWIDVEVQLIHEAVRDQLVNKLTAAIRDDVPFRAPI